MAKISLSTKVKLEITDDGKVLKTFNVTYRTLSRKEQKKLGKENDSILDLFKQSQKTERHIEVAQTRKTALEQMKNRAKDLLKVSEDLDNLYKKKDDLDESFEKLGGFEKMMEASEASFDLSVGGKDKAALKAFIEENGDFSDYLEALEDDVKGQMGN